MSPVLIAREERCPHSNAKPGKPCTCPDRCGVEMACTAGDDDGEPLTRAEGAALLIVVAASAAISVALVAGLLGWLVG